MSDILNRHRLVSDLYKRSWFGAREASQSPLAEDLGPVLTTLILGPNSLDLQIPGTSLPLSVLCKGGTATGYIHTCRQNTKISFLSKSVVF